MKRTRLLNIGMSYETSKAGHPGAIRNQTGQTWHTEDTFAILANT